MVLVVIIAFVAVVAAAAIIVVVVIVLFICVLVVVVITDIVVVAGVVVPVVVFFGYQSLQPALSLSVSLSESRQPLISRYNEFHDIPLHLQSFENVSLLLPKQFGWFEWEQIPLSDQSHHFRTQDI